MKILLIGNGFDLEHGLPTKYSDFLEFCEIIDLFTFLTVPNHKEMDLIRFHSILYGKQSIHQSIKDAIFEVFCNKQDRLIQASFHNMLQRFESEIETEKVPFHCDDQRKTTEIIIDEIYSLIHTNAWYKYFMNRLEKMGANWIDLESEISQVIQALDDARNTKYRHSKTIPHILNDITDSAGMYSAKDIYGNPQLISHFASCLNSHLVFFIRALEIYIYSFVRNVPIERRSHDIEGLIPDHVLSFNYSDTFERIYGEGRNIKYDYIHGKAVHNSTIDSCDLVLGINESLDNHSKNESLDFIPFKKYYQRILKSTGNAHQDWVDEIKAEHTMVLKKRSAYETGLIKHPHWNGIEAAASVPYPKHTLYIFGHSLDITDGDVLRNLICNDNVQTKIYYYREYEHDKRTLGKLIKNLVKIIGPDELIRRTGGSHKTIEFIPQTLHE